MIFTDREVTFCVVDPSLKDFNTQGTEDFPSSTMAPFEPQLPN